MSQWPWTASLPWFSTIFTNKSGQNIHVRKFPRGHRRPTSYQFWKLVGKTAISFSAMADVNINVGFCRRFICEGLLGGRRPWSAYHRSNVLCMVGMICFQKAASYDCNDGKLRHGNRLKNFSFVISLHGYWMVNYARHHEECSTETWIYGYEFLIVLLDFLHYTWKYKPHHKTIFEFKRTWTIN